VAASATDTRRRYDMWHLLMIGVLAELCVIVVLIVVIVHYAREGAHNAGKLEIFERMEQESKMLSIRGNNDAS
jgi:uncharacterized membrane protein